VLSEVNPELRIQATASTAIQEAAEAFLVGLFEEGNSAAIHAGRRTLTKRDIDFARQLRQKKQ
jgi:histone H3